MPTKAWEEEDYPDDDLHSMMNRWLRDYGSILYDMSVADDAPGRSAPKIAYLMQFNAPKMKWFLETADVNSYAEQLRVAEKFFAGKTRFNVALPCQIRRPIGEPTGTNVDCHGVFNTSWFERVPPSWELCQSPEAPPKYDPVMFGVPGQMNVTRFWTTKMHLTPEGQVDVFRLMPARGPDLKVKPGEIARCFLEPHADANGPSVASYELKPDDVLQDAEKNVMCLTAAASRWLTAVKLRGKECWVDTWALTAAVPRGPIKATQ